MTDVLARLLLAPPGGLVFAYIVVITMGGVLYVAMSTRSSPTSTALAVRRPGWIARRRARGGSLTRVAASVSATPQLHGKYT